MYIYTGRHNPHDRATNGRRKFKISQEIFKTSIWILAVISIFSKMMTGRDATRCDGTRRDVTRCDATRRDMARRNAMQFYSYLKDNIKAIFCFL